MRLSSEITELDSGSALYAWSAPDPRGVVVLQHGFLEHAGRWEHEHGQILPRLLESRVSVLALDMWGHGRSPGHRGSVHLGRAVEDHLEVRDRATALGVPVVLVGFSLGGLVTATSVARRPDGLAGVVLLASSLPSPDMFPSPVRRLLGGIARVAPRIWAPIAKQPLSKLSHDQSVAERAAADPLMHDRRLSMLSAVTALDAGGELWASAPSWRSPTLLAHGSEDTFTLPQWSRDLYALLGSEDKTLLEYEGAYHELLDDPVAEGTADSVLAWILVRMGIDASRGS